MASPMDLLENIEALDIPAMTSDTLVDHAEDIVVQNRVQLMEGRLSTGDHISPSYYQDPYFKSYAAAEWWANWKEEITPNPKRPKGVPNLYIDGTFHSTIGLKRDGMDVTIGSDSPIAGDLESTFTNDIYGLNEESREVVFEDKNVRGDFMEKIKAITGLK